MLGIPGMERIGVGGLRLIGDPLAMTGRAILRSGSGRDEDSEES